MMQSWSRHMNRGQNWLISCKFPECYQPYHSRNDAGNDITSFRTVIPSNLNEESGANRATDGGDYRPSDDEPRTVLGGSYHKAAA